MATEPLSLLPAAAPPELLVAFRWSNYDVPFWARPNTRDGRWNRAHGEPTQYWSLSPDAAWAELIRHENLTTEAELDQVRMPFWVCRVPTMHLVDLRGEAERERHAVTLDALVADDWEGCQRVLPTLVERAMGVIAPCAALPEHANITLFGARRAIKWSTAPALASTVPTAKAAIGRPPDGLLARVRRPTPGPLGDRLF